MGNIHTMHRIAHFSIAPRHAAALVRAGQAIRCLATVGVLAGIASSCSSVAPSGSSAAYTHSAQSLVAVITQMAARKETVPSPSLTSSAPSRKTPSATAGSTGTSTLIPTVPLTSHPALPGATYPGSTPTTNGTSLLTSTITSRCNAAYFVGNVAPILENSKVNPGATFVQTWVIRNVGTCTWYPSYMLYWHSGARFEGPKYIDFPEIVPPNTNTFLSLTLIAPDDPGNYYARWYMRDQDFNQFGIGPDYSNPLMIRIIVVA